MSKVTPPGPAGPDRLTTKLNVVVPLSPSAIETSLIDSVSSSAQLFAVPGELVRSSKSSALLFVSAPSGHRLKPTPATVAESAGALEPSVYGAAVTRVPPP